MGFCGKDKKYTDTPQWFDPMGPNADGKHAPTGGPEARDKIFGALQNDITPRSTALAGDAIGAAQRAANHPGFAAAANLASDTIGGKYLKANPYLESALSSARRGALADLSGAQAGAKSNYARSGLSYSTANQQGDQASKAAMLANITGGENQARLQNYQSERGAQERAPMMLEMATGTPLNYLSQLPQLNALPAQQAAQIVQGLSGNGQIATPNSTIQRQPGVVDYALGFTSAIGQAA